MLSRRQRWRIHQAFFCYPTVWHNTHLLGAPLLNGRGKMQLNDTFGAPSCVVPRMRSYVLLRVSMYAGWRLHFIDQYTYVHIIYVDLQSAFKF